ncbi:MAG: hypothetical protein JWN14_3971 [Chthonomonadales bacterium]|nr:hypothetical protein [Chthonomonadales bacterium]
MAILRKSAIALAAVLCLGVAVPAFAQGAGTDKSAADIRAAQATLRQIKALGAEIKARQSGAAVTTTPVAAPVVRQSRASTVAPENGKKATAKKPAKKKKNP